MAALALVQANNDKKLTFMKIYPKYDLLITEIFVQMQ